VYIDAGSNIGVQVRKLFQPDKYPNANAQVIHLYKKHFSAGTTCSVGFEANPRHSVRLSSLQRAYHACGWRAIFYLATAAATSDGLSNIMVLEDGDSEYWGAHMNEWGGGQKGETITTIDLGKYINEVVATRRRHGRGRVGMKIDIEASEFTVLPHLIRTGALCHISFMYMEWHPDLQKHISKEVIKGILASYANSTCRSEIHEIDDETYLHDGIELPNCK